MQIYSLLRKGISHEKRGMPCQDYLEYKILENGTLVLALSDGAGSAKYAKEAAEANVSAVLTFFEHHTIEEVLAWDQRERKEKLLEACFSELKKCAEEIGNLNVQEYSATLLFAAISDKYILIGHIGDGAIYGINEKGNCVYSSNPDNGFSSRQTYFTVSSDRMEHFFLQEINIGEIEQEKMPSHIIMMSDGPYFMFRNRGEGKPEKTVEEMAPFLLRGEITSDENLETLLNQMTELEIEKLDDWSLIIATNLLEDGE